MKKKILCGLLCQVIAVGFFQGSAFAFCALCREALAQGGNEGLVKGFYWSILLIGGVPLAVLGLAGFLLYRAFKRKEGSYLASDSKVV